MDSLFSEATYLCIFPAVILICCELAYPIRISELKDCGRGWMITSAVLSIVYIGMLSVTEVLKGNGAAGMHIIVWHLVKGLLILIGMSTCFIVLLRLGTLQKNGVIGSFKKIGKTPIYAVMTPIICVTLLFVIGCYPGVFSSDSASNWNDVAQNIFSDWHPVTYLYILKVIQRIFGNPFPLILIQAILWIMANQYAVTLLERYTPYRMLDVAYMVFSLIFIYSYRAVGNIEKDGLWNTALFLFCLFLYECIREKFRLSVFKWICFGITGCMVACIRHMGDWIVAVSLLLILVYGIKTVLKYGSKQFWQMILMILAPICGKFILVNLIGFQILHAVPNESYVKYSMPMAMIGAVAVNEIIEDEELAVMEEIMPLERWQECYDKYYADSISRTWGAIGEDIYKLNDLEMQKAVLKLNLKFLFKHPVTYLTAYFDMTSIIWEMGTPTDGYEWIPVSMYSSAIENYPGLAGLQVRHNILSSIDEMLIAFSDRVPVWSSLCWRGGFALFLLVVSGCLLIKEKRGAEVLSMSPLVLLTGVLLLANPSQDPRYIDVFHMAMIFFVLIAVFGKRESGGRSIQKEQSKV